MQPVTVAAEVRPYEEVDCNMYSWRTNDSGLVIVRTDDGPEWVPTLGAANAAGVDHVLARWGDMFRIVSDRWALPDTWLPAMAWRESGGDPRARNTEGQPDDWLAWGVGLFQITSRALKAGHTCDQLFDPQANAETAARYVARQIVAPTGLGYGYDLPRVAAAYNAGSARPDPANPWNLHCTGSHVHAVVAASNYQLLRVEEAVERAIAVQFDLVAPLHLIHPASV